MEKKIHENDDMYIGSIEHYFSCGKQLSEIVYRASKYTEATNPKVLEMPCGYGRVTRHLVEAFDRNIIFVADVNNEGVGFCSEMFGVSGAHIIEPTDEFTGVPDNSFDIAVMGSLITHFSESKSKKMVEKFLRKLKSSGVAIITTHGQRASEILMSDANWFELTPQNKSHLIDSWNSERYGFAPYATEHNFEKKTVELVGVQYGISITPHNWMINLIETLGCTLLEYEKGGWDNHQDVYIIKC